MSWLAILSSRRFNYVYSGIYCARCIWHYRHSKTEEDRKIALFAGLYFTTMTALIGEPTLTLGLIGLDVFWNEFVTVNMKIASTIATIFNIK